MKSRRKSFCYSMSREMYDSIIGKDGSFRRRWDNDSLVMSYLNSTNSYMRPITEIKII